MTLAQVQKMRSRMHEIESLERSGRFAEADLLWDDMLRIASSGKMVRTAFAEAGWLAKLLKFMLPMWREEVGGASRFIHPGKEVENVLRHVRAPFWRNETKIPWMDAWTHLEDAGKDPMMMMSPRDRRMMSKIMKGTDLKTALNSIGADEATLRGIMKNNNVDEEGALMYMSKTPDEIFRFKQLREGIPDASDALNVLKNTGGEDYASKMIYAPGGKQRFQKGLVRNVAVPMGGYATAHTAFGLDRNEGGPTPDQQFDPRMPGTSGRYYPKHLYPSGTSARQGSCSYCGGMKKEYGNPQVADGHGTYCPRCGADSGTGWGGHGPTVSPWKEEQNNMRSRFESAANHEPVPSYEPTGYQPEYDAPDISQWDQGSVAGVVMDPYGRRITRTIPSYTS